MKAYVVNREAPAPEFTPRAVLVSECYAILKRSKNPKTVAQVRATVEAKLEGVQAVRHTLRSLERKGVIIGVDVTPTPTKDAADEARHVKKGPSRQESTAA